MFVEKNPDFVMLPHCLQLNFHTNKLKLCNFHDIVQMRSNYYAIYHSIEIRFFLYTISIHFFLFQQLQVHSIKKICCIFDRHWSMCPIGLPHFHKYSSIVCSQLKFVQGSAYFCASNHIQLKMRCSKVAIKQHESWSSCFNEMCKWISFLLIFACNSFSTQN